MAIGPSANKLRTIVCCSAALKVTNSVTDTAMKSTGLKTQEDEVQKEERQKREADALAKKKRAEEMKEMKSSTKMTDPYEIQTHMVNYEDKGTFDDFNEMAIQYHLR